MERGAQYRNEEKDVKSSELNTLDSAYIGIGYTVFSAIPSIFRPNFGSQKEVYIIDYFGNIIISGITSVLAGTNVADVTGIQCISFLLCTRN